MNQNENDQNSSQTVPRFSELPDLLINPEYLQYLVKMTASAHYNETLNAIMKRKQESIEQNGCVLWPFSASANSIEKILAFMKEHNTYWVFFNEGKTPRGASAAAPLFARSCSMLGSEKRYPIPDGLSARISPSRKNSTWSLVIDRFCRIPDEHSLLDYSTEDKVLRTFTGIELFDRKGDGNKKLVLILAARLKKPYLIRLSLDEPDIQEDLFEAAETDSSKTK